MLAVRKSDGRSMCESMNANQNIEIGCSDEDPRERERESSSDQIER